MIPSKRLLSLQKELNSLDTKLLRRVLPYNKDTLIKRRIELRTLIHIEETNLLEGKLK